MHNNNNKYTAMMNAISTSFDSMEELIENMNSQNNDLFASSSTESASTAYIFMSLSESISYDIVAVGWTRTVWSHCVTKIGLGEGCVSKAKSWFMKM